MSVNYIDKSTGDLIRVAGGGNDILYADSPIGSIIPYGGTTVPDGFLLCNGDQVSKTTYSELYAVIGDSFKGAKADPASGNFYLPDLREVTLKGVGSNYAYDINNHGTINNVGGFMEDRVQDHSHKTYINGDPGYLFGTNVGAETDIHSANADTQNGVGWNVKATTIYTGRHGATTEVKAVGVNYIIKATQVSAPADFAPVDMVENGNMKAVTSNAVYDAIAPIGTVVEDTDHTNFTLVEGGADQTIRTLNLTTGTWIIRANVGWATATNAPVSISITPTTNAYNAGCYQGLDGSRFATQSCCITDIVTVTTASKNFYLTAWAAGAAEIVEHPYFSAVRII